MVGDLRQASPLGFRRRGSCGARSPAAIRKRRARVEVGRHGASQHLLYALAFLSRGHQEAGARLSILQVAKLQPGDLTVSSARGGDDLRKGPNEGTHRVGRLDNGANDLVRHNDVPGDARVRESSKALLPGISVVTASVWSAAEFSAAFKALQVRLIVEGFRSCGQRLSRPGPQIICLKYWQGPRLECLRYVLPEARDIPWIAPANSQVFLVPDRWPPLPSRFSIASSRPGAAAVANALACACAQLRTRSPSASW